ncbi:MAG: hypothetical protein GX802_07615 [Clostridiales bacterium]|nr:hypothetical protein [Clostridiales bacterium]
MFGTIWLVLAVVLAVMLFFRAVGHFTNDESTNWKPYDNFMIGLAVILFFPFAILFALAKM